MNDASNDEINKSISVWLRTISFGIIVAGFIKPLTEPDVSNLGSMVVMVVIGAILFILSLAFLTDIKGK